MIRKPKQPFEAFIIIFFILAITVPAAEMVSFKTKLYDTNGTVDILVYNPKKEKMDLPEPYYPKGLKDIYGPDFREEMFLEKKFDNTKIIQVGGNITMAVTYNDDANEGFYDPTLGSARRAAFEYGLSRWSSRLMGPASIAIVATMSPRGGTANSAVLASCGPSEYSANFTDAPYSNTWYCDALAEAVSGTDPHPESEEIHVDFNSDVDNSTVLGDMDFYYGTDGNCGTDIDFVTVTVHEMGHGLGFTSSIQSNGRWGLWGEDDFYPTIYDRFLTRSDGIKLIDLSMNDVVNSATGGDVFWNGLIGKYSCNHEFSSALTRVPIFAPNPWDDGSSISHIDEATFSGGAYELMTPESDNVIHTPDSIVLGMLQDMGWSLSKSRYVNDNAAGAEDGSSFNPFNTLAEGLSSVPEGGYLRFYPGSYGTTTITGRNLNLRSCGGSAVLGAIK